MYKVVNFQTGELLAKEDHISFVKQQVNIDFPIGCETLEEADGIVIYIDGVERTLGIEGRNMQNYTPTVLVEEVSVEERILEEVEAQKDLQLASMLGQADQYNAALATQEQVNAQQQLILANMQGLADVYTTLLTMQAQTTPNETEEQ